MASLNSLLCAVLIIVGYTVITCYAAEPNKRNSLFVFGDSLFDPGNNIYFNKSIIEESTRWPYGQTYFKHPTGRYSDGRLVPDFIAQFANLPILPPYLQLQNGEYPITLGANFASAGAGVVLPNTYPQVINLPKQLSYLKDVVKSLKQNLGHKKAKKVLNNAVYLFGIGGNDIFAFYMENPNATQSYQTQYVDMVIANLTNTLKEIYILGGRKFALQNIGPMDSDPISNAMNVQTGGGSLEMVSAMTKEYNRALSLALKKLDSTLPGFKYSLFDNYNALLDKINEPSKYGFKDGKTACCGSGAYRASGCGGEEKFEVCNNPAEYLFFDGAHNTERANRQLAEQMWNGPPKITWPYTVKQLFGYTK